MARLSHAALRRVCTPKELSSASGAAGDDGMCANPELFLGCGQERFRESLELAAASSVRTHNVIVSGLSGRRGFEVIEAHLRQIVADMPLSADAPAPRDWCYVFNFEEPNEPMALSFQRGEGRAFKKATAELREKLKRAIHHALENKTHTEELGVLWRNFRLWISEERTKLQAVAKEHGLYFAMQSDGRFRFLPRLKALDSGCGDDVSEDAYLSEDEMEQLPPERLRRVHDMLENVRSATQQFAHAYEEKQKEILATSEQMEKSRIEGVVNELFDEYLQTTAAYGVDDDAFREFFKWLKQYTLDNYSIFTDTHSESEEGEDQYPFLPWDVNVYVTHDDGEQYPIVSGSITSSSGIVGHIKTVSTMGVEYADHMKIYPGKVEKANGGFLILNLEDLVYRSADPWVLLKRIIRNQEITIETPLSLHGLRELPLRPRPIPAHVRVIVFGSAHLVDVVQDADLECAGLFKIRADILPDVPRTSAQVRAYSMQMQSLAGRVARRKLAPKAICRLVEHAGRLAEHRGRLSTDIEHLRIVIAEAGVIATRESSAKITGAHIKTALEKHVWRKNAVYDRILETMGEKQKLIDVAGSAVGTINALAIIAYNNDVRFGMPARITAEVSAGTSGVINIHRGMSGLNLKKADLIVQGLLKKTFAEKRPLSLDVHFSFEQTYGMVDGDSASLAEYYVILSSLSRIPIHQGIAITGSMNLHGDVQPISRANEKIEGFFDTCRALGALTGKQGVIIPHQNKAHLMLREDVVEAVRKKRFHVWAIESLEEGISLLTGRNADEVYRAAHGRLSEFLRSAKQKLPSSHKPFTPRIAVQKNKKK